LRYKRLGKCGVKVSEFCLGTMIFGAQVNEDTAANIVRRAIDLGINFIDTADVYTRGRSEEIVGKVIKDMRREDIVLATKVRQRMGPGPNDEGLSRKYIMHEVDESLRRLCTDYIDIYYCHRPSNADLRTGFAGEPVPLEETLGALTDLVRSGKVHYLGCSNFPAWLHCKALWVSDINGLERFDVSQPVYNLLNREIEREILPLCVDQGIAVVPYSPLAGGVLTGKYKAGTPAPLSSRGAVDLGWIKSHNFFWEDAEQARILESLHRFSNECGRPMAQVALAWLLANPTVTAPIVGASSVQQLEESLGAAEVNFSKADLEKIDGLAPAMGPYFT
jgi:aryl-alcohol dehydrogenase-like predicted oxidoreductase